MVPLRQGKVADPEITPTHGLGIDAQAAEQGQSFGEGHCSMLRQFMVVVDQMAQLTDL